MATTLQHYTQLANQTAVQVTGSYQDWTAFLRTMARLYKYRYHEQLMIHAQRPDATACATYEIWNKQMHRYVRGKNTGIALIDTSGDNPKLKYVFDVSDTQGGANARYPYLFQFRQEHELAVTNALMRHFDIGSASTLPDLIEEISDHQANAYWDANKEDILHNIDGSFISEYDEENIRYAFHEAVVVGSAYTVMARCGMNPDVRYEEPQFMTALTFNTPRSLAPLGIAISQTSETILRQIEAAINQYERHKFSERSQNHENANLSKERGLLHPQPEPVRHEPAAAEQIREDAEEIPPGASPRAVEQHDSGRNPVRPSAGDRPDSEPETGTDSAPAATDGRGNGGTESQRSHEMGRADEYPESTGRGDDSGGADLRLTDEESPILGEQFSFFPTEAQQIAYIAEAESADIALSAFSMPQEYIDQFLRVGSNTENHRTRIAIEYAKQQPMDYLVGFLEKTYHGGYGLQFGGTKVCAWYAEDGMRIAYGSAARYARNAQIISWENVAARIGELLEQGQFATNVELAECGTFEKRQLAEQLWYMSHDMSEKAVEAGHMSIVCSLRGGFPEETEKLMVFLSEPESYQAIIRQVFTFRDACNADKSMMRFQMYNPNKLIRSLEEYTLPRREYVSELAELPAANGFITEDEINVHLTGGSNFSGSKSRIYAFYQQPHIEKEKLNFLKNEYGIGGGNGALSNNFMSHVWSDGKGIRYDKPNCTRMELPWTKVVKYYDSLMESGLLAPPKELGQRYGSEEIIDGELAAEQPEAEGAELIEAAEPIQVESEPAVWEYNEIKSAHPEDIVLFQVGDFFEIYGEDAKEAAAELNINLTTRAIPGGGRVEMCGFPANQLEQMVERLRDKHDVTISAVPEGGKERQEYSMLSIDHEAGQHINAQEAKFGADGNREFRDTEATAAPTIRELHEKYKPIVMEAVTQDTRYRNACGHSDYENAKIECNAAVRRAVLGSKDMELIRLFSDVPEFRQRLHREVIDETYPKLHELLRPLSQEDIDTALCAWNGNIESKHAVVRYMKDHAREKDTAAWLAQEYGGSNSNSLFITRAGSPEETQLSWAKVQRRIAQLIQEDRFYTEEEQDRFDDIDPIAIREALAERGIVNGQVVDPEKLDNDPFIQQVMSDVAHIAAAEAEQAPKVSIPDEEHDAVRHPIPHPAAPVYAVGDTVYIEDDAYQITELRDDTVQLLDPTLRYPIYRVESREYFERLLNQDSRNRAFTDFASADLEKADTDLKEVLDEHPVSVQVNGQWQTFPNVKAAENASYEEYKASLRRNAQNFRITDEHFEGGPKAKFQANVNAIRLLKELEAAGQQASPEQQEVLSRYVGWGGVSDAFDPQKPAWASEYALLKELLTPEEYSAARASTLNAHYTSPTVIRAIYEALGNMGFQTGNILEPSCGVGNFFGMLPEEMRNSRLYGVELDPVSGRIAKQLYPKANITVAGFETTDRRDFYDLAIGNVPFGQYQVNDKAYNTLNFSIHNYFFAKALDQVRPGGVVAFVTSRYTMDAKDSTVRRYLAQRAELLGAIRLPNDAFKKNAGAEVVSDIIFLQKRDRPLDIVPEWTQTGRTEDGYTINSYFLDHPEMVMGKNSSQSTAHGMDYTVEPLEDISLADLLHEAVQHIRGSYQEAELPDLGEGETIQNTLPADPDVKNFSYTLVDGEIYFRENSIMVRPDLNATAKERIKGMIELRTCVQELIDLQMEETVPDSAIHAKQTELNQLYDTFTAKYGIINNRGNKLAFSDDSSYFLLCALEVMDDDGNFQRKADMFTRRTIKPHHAVTSVDTASEALTLSIGEKARVDLEYMSQLTGKSPEELVKELQGIIFKDPASDSDALTGWQTADEYLSGNVRKKLRQAEAAAADDPAYQSNVQALRAAQPTDLDASEIEVQLGATWIDKSYIQQFMNELLRTPLRLKNSIQVQYSSYTAAWFITNKTHIPYDDVAAYNTYGTDRASAYDILEDTLNLRDVRIYDTVEDEHGKDKRVLNAKETTLAAQKQQLIRDAFRDWIWKDPERRKTLVKQYNEEMNSTRPREYDGSHITFVGMNPEITLREHQRNAIAHVLYGGNTLLAHEVGSGKTFEMIAAAMESKRLGLCQKSIFVVPNHLTEQWASEFLRLYPSANILVTKQRDFETHNRKKFCSRIATGDYDAIIIGHSQFERIPISQKRQERLLQDQIAEITMGISEVQANGGERFTVKQLERTKRSLKARLEKLEASHIKDDVITFEQLGVDRMFVDEAHSYKNRAKRCA